MSAILPASGEGLWHWQRTEKEREELDSQQLMNYTHAVKKVLHLQNICF